MSDTTRTIVGIIVAVAVIAVIARLFVSSRRRREDESRRSEAADLRSTVEQRLPEVTGQEDRASVTEQIASDAREEAARKAAEAERLERQAAEHRSAAEAARAEHEQLEREADRIDPDVETDDEGHRLDEARRQAAQAHEMHPGATGAVGTAAVGAAGVGAAAALAREDEDDDDLADAENPFAPTAPATDDDAGSPGGDDWQATAQAYAADDVAAPSAGTDERAVEVSNETDDSTLEGGVGTPVDDSTDDPTDSTDVVTESGPSGYGSGAGDTTSAAADSDEGNDVSDNTTSQSTPEDQDVVSVPALDDKDDVVADSGTPSDDPGDHRGQPWATTPGEPGPEPADGEPGEGLGEDAALGARTDPEQDVRVGEESDADATAARATDATAARAPEADEPVAVDHAEQGSSAEVETAADEQPAAARRVSSFDEVVDGGFGIGSAAPIGDGAQPLGHAVKGSRDGSSYVAPGDEAYDDVEPDVWFYNEEAARRAGFTRQGE